MMIHRFVIFVYGITGLFVSGQDGVATQAVVEDVSPVALSKQPSAVVSRTKQFLVSGGDSMVRGMAVILTEEAKEELLRLLEEEDKWKVPVSVVLHGQLGDPSPARTIASRLTVVEGSPQLRMDKHLSRGLEPVRFKQVVTEMLVCERAINAAGVQVLDSSLLVPPWLTIGLCEASAWRMNQSDRNLYAAVFKQGGLFKLEELFAFKADDYEGMDGATKSAFRVSSGSLVMALLMQPQGKAGLRHFLNQVASYQGEMPILMREHFPELNLSGNSLEKWWALQLANQGERSLLTDVMTVDETEAKLLDALQLDIPLEGGASERLSLGEWQALGASDDSERMAAVKYAQTALVRLSYRCFPSYRPLLVEYQKILIDIVNNRTAGVAAALAELEDARATMKGRAERARDYMDWFEITRARKTSGAFDDYLKLKKDLKTQRKKRNDPVSEYLDKMDQVFHRGAQ